MYSKLMTVLEKVQLAKYVEDVECKTSLPLHCHHIISNPPPLGHPLQYPSTQ
jgi:hypothetical protein